MIWLIVLMVVALITKKLFDRSFTSNTLFVCTKCSTDIEDVVVTSGCTLFQKIQEKFDDEWVKIGPKTYKNKENNEIKLCDMKCLGNCKNSNNIAFRSDKKYNYQFQKIPLDASSDISKFSSFWINSKEGYSSKRTRPESLKTTIVSRVPPIPK